MKLGVVGGGLRGLEMAYLGRRQAFERSSSIRSMECPHVRWPMKCTYVTSIRREEIVKELLFACDAVIPAIEDEDACAMLEAMMHRSGIPLIYDRRTAHIGRSKVLSFKLMRSLGIPIPTSYPECDFPALVTPSKRGRDPGFTRVDDQKQLEKKIKKRT